MVKVHALSRIPRRVLSLTASMAMVVAIVPAVTLLTASAANAANPVQVQMTLEGCRRPAPAAKCTYNANQNQSDFTTGDLGKNWAELDFVPHRLTLVNNGPDQDFQIRLSADHMLNGKLGYDYIKQGWDSTFNTTAKDMFTGDCNSTNATVVSGHENEVSPTGVVGGVDTALTDELDIHMAPGATCYVSFEVRLGIGSHLYSGSSLQTQVLNADYSSTGQRTVSIPVKEIAPQVATTAPSASTNTNYTWALDKTGSSGISINSCDPAPTTPNVSFTVSWTRTEHAPTGLTVSGTVTLTNPSVRDLTTHSIVDTVTNTVSGTAHNYSQTVTPNVTVPGATSSGPGTKTVNFGPISVPAPIGTLTNSAVVTYDDPDQSGLVLTGLSTGSTPVTINVTNTTSNKTAGLSDSESFTAGTGLKYKRTAPAANATTGFVSSDTFTQSGLDAASGGYTIQKIVEATTPGNFTGTLHDAVTLTPSDGGTSGVDSPNIVKTADISITVTAANPTITITKTVDVAPTTDTTFPFTITNNQDNTTYPVSVTILANHTSGVSSAVSVTPSTTADTSKGYTITESVPAGYSGGTTYVGDLALCGSASPSIVNTRLLGHVRVHKVLQNDGPVADASKVFKFDVSCTNGYSTGTHPLIVDLDVSPYASTPDSIPTGTSCTITEETPPTGWHYVSSDPSNGTVTAQQTDSSTNTVTVTNARDLGEIKIAKSLVGDVAGASTSFSFDWSCASTDGTYSDSGTVTIDPVNDAHPYQIITGIPTGVQCTVAENPAGDSNWELTSSNNLTVTSTKSPDSSTNTAAFTNTRKLGRLVVNKTVTGAIADAPLTFVFDYTCADGAYTGTITVNVDATSKTGSNHSLSNIPVGVSCTITEQTPDSHWSLTTTVPQDGSATSEAGTTDNNTVSFTNARVLGGVEVKKVLDGPIAGAEHSFTFSVECSSQDGTYSHTFTPTIDPTVDDTWSSGNVIPTGVSCMVTETGDYPHWTLETVSPDGGVVVAGSESNLVTVTNLRDYGHVTVIKTLDGDIAGAETTFTFHVVCDGVDQALLPDLVIDASGEGNTGTASTNDVIPTDVACTVTEVGTYAHWTLESVTPHGEDPTVGSVVAAATDGEANTVVFTNQRLMGVITVDKTRVGQVADASTVFVFDIVCADDPAYDQTLTIDTADSATASATSTPIPTDVACTVSERTTDGWQQTDPASGGVNVTVPGTAEFTNTRLTGPLQLTKSVTPSTGSYTAGDPNNTLTYTLTMSEPAPGQLDHTGVVVTDYIPGYDPADTTSGKTTYVDGSATCSTGCSSSYDASQHLLTWNVGSYKHDDAPLVLTFKVTIDSPTPAANGAIPAEQIDNVGFVASVQQPKTPSNQVVVPVLAVLGEKVVKPPKKPQVLPFTGSALPLRPAATLALFMLGIGAVLTRVRRREDGHQ